MGPINFGFLFSVLTNSLYVDHERTNLFAFFSHLDRDDLGDSAGARHTQLLRAAEQASMKLDEFRRSTNHQYWQLRSVVRGLYDDAAKVSRFHSVVFVFIRCKHTRSELMR